MTFYEAIETTKQNISSDKAKGLNGIFQFEISGEEGGSFYIAFADGNGTLTEGVSPKADIYVTTSLEVYSDILEGKINPNKAFFTGKLKFKGDMSMGLKLQSLLG